MVNIKSEDKNQGRSRSLVQSLGRNILLRIDTYCFDIFIKNTKWGSKKYYKKLGSEANLLHIN